MDKHPDQQVGDTHATENKINMRYPVIDNAKQFLEYLVTLIMEKTLRKSAFSFLKEISIF